MEATVLFLTNGLGLGNSTRCHAIIQRLHAKGARIEVVTSNNGLWYFAGRPEVRAVHEIQPLTYGSRDGAISIARTFAGVGDMVGIFRRNARKIGARLDEIRPDVVVTDSDYNFLPVRRRRIPIVALNNADVVWDSYFRFADRPADIRAQFYGVEMLDYAFHRLVPDLVISPSLDPEVRGRGGNILAVGPIVRQEYEALLRRAPVARVAVMLSGSVFGTPVNFAGASYPARIDVIGRDRPEGMKPYPAIVFHGKIKDTLPLLREADVAVVNGGFSAVSEMAWMKKPLVVVPVPRHAEQWINARTIEHLGLGLIASQSDYERVMLEAVARADEFRAGYARLGAMEDGAAQAAKAILELADGRRAS